VKSPLFVREVVKTPRTRKSKADFRRLAFEVSEQDAAFIHGEERGGGWVSQQKKNPNTITIHSPAVELTFQIFFWFLQPKNSQYSPAAELNLQLDLG